MRALPLSDHFCPFATGTPKGGSAIENRSSTAIIFNSIIWGNTGASEQIYNDDESATLISFSDIQGGYPGEGNINAPPLFVDPENRDFHLDPNSPCIDAGTNDVELTDTDLDGYSRVTDGNGDAIPVVDMGAYEFVVPVLIDVLPKDDGNQIKLTGKRKIPVAILSTESFYAPDQVDKSSLSFGATGDEDCLKKCDKMPQDVNDDGHEDLVCDFWSNDTGLQDDDTECILKGYTMDGLPIEGRYYVEVVKRGKNP
jgi:hypothetical protein